LPLNPGEEAFHQPAPLIATQSAAVLCIGFKPSLPMWRDHFNAFLAQFFIQFVAVVGTITNQIHRLRLDHVEVKTQLHQSDFMMVGDVRTDCQRQAVTIHNCHDFHTLTTLRRSDIITAALDRCKGCIEKAIRFIQRTFITKCIGQIGHRIALYFISTPVLKPPVDCFVVRIALRQHATLCTRIENPEYGFKDFACKYVFAAFAIRRNMFLRKVFPDTSHCSSLTRSTTRIIRYLGVYEILR